jgi:hypothetical protein
MSEEKEKPKPIATETFLKQVPSSRAESKPTPPRLHSYEIRVQRRETGRWNQVGRFTVTTVETDMIGPLRMGLKDNYRILITESTEEETSDTTEEQ